MDPFDRVVRSEDELREILGTPSARSLAKQHDSLDVHDPAFIALSPLILMSTSGAGGRCDVSPTGDGPGFVLVIDERRLVIPDRPGNKRLDVQGQDAAPRHRCGGGRGLPPLPEGVSEVSLFGFGTMAGAGCAPVDGVRALRSDPPDRRHASGARTRHRRSQCQPAVLMAVE
jgi:hypothetical protein